MGVKLTTMSEMVQTTPTTEETINKILDRIIETYEPEKIILFGSYAYGNPHPDSDLDLLIIKETTQRPIDRRIEVRTLLRALKLNAIVSPLVVTKDEIEERLKMGDPFAKEIVSRGRVLYERA